MIEVVALATAAGFILPLVRKLFESQREMKLLRRQVEIRVHGAENRVALDLGVSPELRDALAGGESDGDATQSGRDTQSAADRLTEAVEVLKRMGIAVQLAEGGLVLKQDATAGPDQQPPPADPEGGKS